MVKGFGQHRGDPNVPIEDMAGTVKALMQEQKPWIVPIPGTAKLHRLEENIGRPKSTLRIRTRDFKLRWPSITN